MQIDTGTDTVLAEVIEGVGIITLNRPERRNALHYEILETVPRLLERFVEDPAVGCIMVTGAGPSFCSGGDVGGNTFRRPSSRRHASAEGDRQRTGPDVGGRRPHDPDALRMSKDHACRASRVPPSAQV